MNFLLTYRCLSNCKFCFVPKEIKKEQTEMSFIQFKKNLDHINKLCKNKKPVLGILGGEPTLAKDFPMIISYAKTYKGGVRLYSNLITDTKNIEYLLGSKNIVVSWNIDSYLQANEKNKKLILKNLKLIKQDLKDNFLVSITLYENFKIKDFSKIINLLKKYDIKNIRIALDSTNYDSFKNYGLEIFEFIKYLKKHNFNLFSSSCGHFVKHIFTREQETYLKKNVINFKYHDCAKDYPLDVLPNGTVVPCISFANRSKNINFLDYNTLEKLKTKINKEYRLNNIKDKNCIANNNKNFKTIIGFNPTDTIEFLNKHNIKEVYCGYYDKCLESKWPVSFGCINRRGEGVNFSSWESLIQFSNKAYKNNIKVYITLNSLYYIKQQYSWLKKLILKIKKEKSITGVIVNDLGLLLFLKKNNFNKDITISTLATAFNSNAIKFYKQFGVNRIVLDRQFTPEEIVDLVTIHEDMDFEIFVISTGGCLFIDGYCSLLHCFEQLKNKNQLGNVVKAQKYDLITTGAGCCTILNNFNNKNFKSNEKIKFKISKTLGFSCNICMLYKLKNINNISLKIDSRGSNGSGVTNVDMTNELIFAVNDSKDNLEYMNKAQDILYKYKKVKCNPKICLYYKDKK